MKDIDLLAVGLTTLDIAIHPFVETPEIDAGALVETVRLSPAGTAGGAALVAARLGLRVAIASAVGDDLQGHAVRDGLRREGVAVEALTTDAAMPTSTTVLPVRTGGQRSTLHMIGASMTAPLGDAAWQALDRAKAVHWGGIGCVGLAGQAVDFLRRARENGAFVTCDLISPQPAAREEVITLLPFVDLFMPSIAEVRILTGTDDLAEAARQFMAYGAGGCAFKLGADGAILITPSGTMRVPAHPIDPIDTTSCGDSFCAGFHAARHHGLGPEDCLRVATATAARVAQGVGTLGALTDYATTRDFARAGALL